MAPTEAVSVASFAATRSQPVPPVAAPGSTGRSGQVPVVRVNPSAFVAHSAEDLTGRTISERYEIMSRLTQGGMGVVYQARHVLLDTVVALKVLLRGEEADEQRFLREARLASKINHPNTVYISDFGVLPDGRTYLVMEYLKGKTLGSVLLTQGPRLDPLRACRIAVQIARGLQAVHDKGVVHRDLKPDNVFLLEQDGQADFVKIVDFGIAKPAEHGISVGDSGLVRPLSKEGLAQLAAASGGDGNNITMAGTVMGTPGYMAPEQIQGHKQDERVDQYALGCLLYEMLVGQPVFKASGPMTLMIMHASDPVLPPHARLAEQGAPALPESLDRLVCRLLSKEPRERFASMTELAGALEREIEIMQIQRGERTVVPTALVQSISQPPASLPPTPTATPAAGLWRNPMALGVAGLLLIAVAMAGALWGLRQRPAMMGTADESVPRAELLALRKSALALLSTQAQPKAGGDPARQTAALLGLGQSRDAQQRPILEAVLQSAQADPAARQAAAEALAVLGDRAALPALKAALAALPTPTPSRELATLRLRIGATLQQLGDESGQALLHEALSDRDPATALRAALLLCAPQPPALRGVIEKALAEPQLPAPLRGEALFCLARLGDAAATQHLQAQAGLPGGAVGPAASVSEDQLLALSRLAQLQDAAALAQLRTLAQRRGGLQLLAAHELARLDGEEGLAVLRSVASDAQAVPTARQLALAGLSWLGRPIDARRLGLLLSLTAAAPPAESGERELLSQLAAAAIVQIIAREPSLLSQSGLSFARSAYLDASWTTREAAASVLADASGGDALRLLAALLRDGDSKVRVAAARALGRRREPEALALLKTALGDSEGEVRREALRSLDRLVVALALAKRGQVGSVSASDIGAIVKGLFDAGSAGEQVAAAAVLLRLSDKATLDKVQAWRSAEDPAMRRLYLSRVASERAELLAGLKDRVLAVRLAAAERLSELPGDPLTKEALPVLQEAVRAGGVEAVAAFALLARLGDRSLPAPPEAPLFTGSTGDRLAAIEALSRLPHRQAVPLLLRAAADPEPLVRRLVAEVAADLSESGPAGSVQSGELAPGVPVLRLLVRDADAVVRARAESLLGRLLQQSSVAGKQAGLADLLNEEGATPAKAGKDPATATAREASSEPAARDGGTPPDAAASEGRPEPGSPASPGEGKLGSAKPKPLAAESFARTGLAAYVDKDFKRAQKLLEKAHALCSRERKQAVECAALTYETSLRLGQIYEQQKALPEAMAEFQKVLHSASVPRGKAALRGEAQEAVGRLQGRLGQVIVRSPGKGKRAAACDETTMWMRPGPALIKVDGKLEPIEVRAQAVTKVGSCP